MIGIKRSHRSGFDSLGCEDGWSYSNKSCYWYNAELLTWNEAEVHNDLIMSFFLYLFS